MLNALMFKGWTVEEDHYEDRYLYRLEASYNLRPEHCPSCGSVRQPIAHGSPVVLVRDSPMRGKRVQIRLKRSRYICKDCGSTFSQQIPELHPDFDMTNRLVEYIQDQGLRKPYAEVRRNVGVRSDKTISNICQPYLRWLTTGHALYAPVILGIDELKLDGGTRIVLTDTGERRVIEMLPDDESATLANGIKRLPNYNRIVAVTLDMRSSFRKVVRETLPWATIIADKFHVLRMANKRLDEFRSAVKTAHEVKRKEARAAGRRVPKKLKYKWSDRRLLHMSPEKRTKLKPMKRMMFEATLANDQPLHEVWVTKEAFYMLWKAKDAAEAKCMFTYWKNNLPPAASPHFTSVARQIEDWHGEVFAYFNDPYTNAYAEAANRLIRAINRRGNGYKFAGIRARAIHMTLGRESDHFICEDCLGRFPVHQGRLQRLLDDILPPVMVCADGCERPRGLWFFRALAFGTIPTPKSE